MRTLLLLLLKILPPHEDSYMVGNTINEAYANHLSKMGIKIWRFPFSDLGIDYQKTKLSTLEHHPNLTTHRAYAYYLALSFIKENSDIKINDESKNVILKKLEQSLLQQSAKLK